MKAVGARLPRYDGVAHVTGRTTFVDDVRIPGTLWVKALRSPAHHADIKRLDISKAEAMEGVHAIITWEDVPLLEYGHLSALGIPADEPLLAKDDVRYKGQPIAVVAADDEVVAQAAVDAIELELAEKPGALRRPQGVRLGRAQGASLGQLVPALRGGDGSPPDPQGLDPGGVRQGGRDRAGRLPPGSHRARPGRDAGVPGRAGGRRPAHDLLLHAGALLLDGRRRRAPGGAAEPAEVRRRNRRRRLRRQGRHRHRDDVRAPGAEVRQAGEVALDARGGVPLLVHAGAVAHGDRGRGDEGRLDPRPQDADAPRLRRVLALLAVRPDEAQLPPHGRVHDPAPRVRRLRASTRTACRRPRCAASASPPSRSRSRRI